MEPNELENLIDEFLKNLSLNQKIIFSLTYGLNELGTNWNTQEIANIMGVSYTTIYDQKKAIIKKLNMSYFRKIVEALCCP